MGPPTTETSTTATLRAPLLPSFVLVLLGIAIAIPPSAVTDHHLGVATLATAVVLLVCQCVWFNMRPCRRARRIFCNVGSAQGERRHTERLTENKAKKKTRDTLISHRRLPVRLPSFFYALLLHFLSLSFFFIVIVLLLLFYSLLRRLLNFVYLLYRFRARRGKEPNSAAAGAPIFSDADVSYEIQCVAPFIVMRHVNVRFNPSRIEYIFCRKYVLAM